MIDYPENFPQPSTNLSGNVENPTIRTELDNGLVEQASRYSSGLTSLSVSWEVSAEELLTFEEWFNNTLAGGVLVFGLMLPKDGATEIQPVRFVGGSYAVRHKAALWFTISARVELLQVNNAPANRTLPIPAFLRVSIDPAVSQNLTLAHRNAILTVRPAVASQTTLRIFPPTDPTQYIYFGINNQGLGDTLITSEDVEPILPPATPEFPSSLPNINQAFGQNAQRKASRIDMDSGHPRQYAGLETTVKMYEVEWDFNLDQLQTFQDFFHITLTNGELPFVLTLPVDGVFLPVTVRFVGGNYSEAYLPVDNYRVNATVERIVEQTVLPSAALSFPLYYRPTVTLGAGHHKASGLAGRFIVATPAEGEVTTLHISSTLIEFGLLIVGLGNVLITRAPFLYDLGTLTEGVDSGFAKTRFSLSFSELDLGTIEGDYGASAFAKPSFMIQSVFVDLGTIPGDSPSTLVAKPVFDLRFVDKDGGSHSDSTGATFGKPSFSLT